jgi:hypothetical protein
MADPIVTPEQDKALDDFEAAFAQISEADAAGKTVAPADIKAAPVVEKTAEQIEAERVAAEAAAATKAEADAAAAVAKANEGKTPEQIAEETAAAAAAKAEADAAAAEAAKIGDQDLVSRLATLIKGADPQAAAREAAAAAEAQRVADAAAAAEAAAKAQPQIPQLSESDLAIVRQFEKDFPDVAQAQAIVRKAEYQVVTSHIFKEVRAYFEQKMAEQLGPVAALVQNLAERTHVGDLKTVVPDYDKVDVKALAAWVGKQPAYLRSGMDTVMRTGRAEDVKDLIDRFRADTGVKLAGQVVDPKVAAAAAAAETQRQKAIKALAPVPSQRAGAVAAETPTSFDDAFGVFAKELAAAEANDRFTR